MISLVLVYLGLAAIAPLCALAQHLVPAGEPPAVFTRARRIDWAYWLVTPLGTGFLTRAATLGVVAVIAVAIGAPFHDADDLMDVFHARSPVAAWPLAVQAGLALVLADFISYWSHRVRHHRRFFPLHAVHHSAERLDWLAAARMHPLDDLADNVAVTLPILLFGFDPRIFVVLGPLLILHTLYLHASVRLSLGPLRFVIASPDFHRLHHAVDPAAQNAPTGVLATEGPDGRGRSSRTVGTAGASRCNYGGVFSIWDVMFGTFRMPSERPTAFGLDAADALPESLGAQLVLPLKRLARSDR